MNFYKMSACSNDFLVVDLRDQKVVLDKARIISLANYKTKIGFDQLITVEHCSYADALIKIFNSDGSESLACGNGTRCIAKLIFDQFKKKEITLATKERILKAYYIDQQVAVNMGQVKIIKKNIVFKEIVGDHVEIGNPHIIITNSTVNYLEYGPLIEKDLRFPGGINVNFAQILNPTTINLKVWERGAGSTLACGSGACATFFLLYSKGLINKEAIIKQAGGDISIFYDKEGIIMKGDANYNYRGTINE
jgi:diaminopimelate epimerase